MELIDVFADAAQRCIELACGCALFAAFMLVVVVIFALAALIDGLGTARLCDRYKMAARCDTDPRIPEIAKTGGVPDVAVVRAPRRTRHAAPARRSSRSRRAVQ